jgi:hypothetical protein
MVKNLEENHDMWVKIIEAETQQSEQLVSPEQSTEGKVRRSIFDQIYQNKKNDSYFGN